MKPIILAAGVGKRLRPFTDDNPKCFVELKGKKLIDRYFEVFADFGLKEAVIVVGHCKDKIMAHVGDEYKGVKVSYVHNDEFNHGNILSKWLARDYFDDDVLFMDADVVFHPALLRKLIDSPNKNCYLLDDSFDKSGEEMLVAAKNGRVLENARKLINDGYDAVGEGTGFLKMSEETAKVYGKMLDEAVKAGRIDDEYEEVLKDLLKVEVFGYEPTDGIPWREIDFPQDITRIENETLPKIPW